MLEAKSDGHPRYDEALPGVSHIAVCDLWTLEWTPLGTTAQPGADQRLPQAVVDAMFHEIISYNWPEEATAGGPRQVCNRVGGRDRETPGS
jgi:hypothetical protein